jgi:hypothetical protein
MTLSVLAALQKKQAFGGFGVLGIIKETGVDDQGVVEFEEDCFRFPLFCDKSYSFYQALGDRKLSVNFILNPISLFSIVCDTYQRITSKGIQGNFKGEGLVQGGIIIFDNGGNPMYAYEEETGEDLPVKDNFSYSS